MIDLRGTHGRPGLSKSHPGPRPISQITGIVLHQTACRMSPGAWKNVHAHAGVDQNGVAYQIYDWRDRVNHGHDFNATTVGIEFEGHFEGIQGAAWTHWVPVAGPNDPPIPAARRVPMIPTKAQIESGRYLIVEILQWAQENGGEIKHVFAHRQSSDQRQGDPGSAIWKALGLWAQEEFGLTDGGPGYVIGTGLPIPEAWDPRYAGVKY